VIEAGLNIKVKWDKNKRTIYLNEYTNESITIVGNDNSVILGSNILVNISPRYDIDTVNKIIGENDEMLVEKIIQVLLEAIRTSQTYFCQGKSGGIHSCFDKFR